MGLNMIFHFKNVILLIFKVGLVLSTFYTFSKGGLEYSCFYTRKGPIKGSHHEEGPFSSVVYRPVHSKVYHPLNEWMLDLDGYAFWEQLERGVYRYMNCDIKRLNRIDVNSTLVIDFKEDSFEYFVKNGTVEPFSYTQSAYNYSAAFSCYIAIFEENCNLPDSQVDKFFASFFIIICLTLVIYALGFSGFFIKVSIILDNAYIDCFSNFTIWLFKSMKLNMSQKSTFCYNKSGYVYESSDRNKVLMKVQGPINVQTIGHHKYISQTDTYTIIGNTIYKNDGILIINNCSCISDEILINLKDVFWYNEYLGYPAVKGGHCLSVEEILTELSTGGCFSVVNPTEKIRYRGVDSELLSISHIKNIGQSLFESLKTHNELFFNEFKFRNWNALDKACRAKLRFNDKPDSCNNSSWKMYCSDVKRIYSLYGKTVYGCDLRGKTKAFETVEKMKGQKNTESGKPQSKKFLVNLELKNNILKIKNVEEGISIELPKFSDNEIKENERGEVKGRRKISQIESGEGQTSDIVDVNVDKYNSYLKRIMEFDMSNEIVDFRKANIDSSGEIKVKMNETELLLSNEEIGLVNMELTKIKQPINKKVDKTMSLKSFLEQKGSAKALEMAVLKLQSEIPQFSEQLKSLFDVNIQWYTSFLGFAKKNDKGILFEYNYKKGERGQDCLIIRNEIMDEVELPNWIMNKLYCSIKDNTNLVAEKEIIKLLTETQAKPAKVKKVVGVSKNLLGPHLDSFKANLSCSSMTIKETIRSNLTRRKKDKREEVKSIKSVRTKCFGDDTKSTLILKPTNTQNGLSKFYNKMGSNISLIMCILMSCVALQKYPGASEIKNRLNDVLGNCGEYLNLKSTMRKSFYKILSKSMETKVITNSLKVENKNNSQKTDEKGKGKEESIKEEIEKQVPPETPLLRDFLALSNRSKTQLKIALSIDVLWGDCLTLQELEDISNNKLLTTILKRRIHKAIIQLKNF